MVRCRERGRSLLAHRSESSRKRREAPIAVPILNYANDVEPPAHCPLSEKADDQVIVRDELRPSLRVAGKTLRRLPTNYARAVRGEALQIGRIVRRSRDGDTAENVFGERQRFDHKPMIGRARYFAVV